MIHLHVIAEFGLTPSADSFVWQVAADRLEELGGCEVMAANWREKTWDDYDEVVKLATGIGFGGRHGDGFGSGSGYGGGGGSGGGHDGGAGRPAGGGSGVGLDRGGNSGGNQHGGEGYGYANGCGFVRGGGRG